jgi:hypothetical protein
LIVLQPEQRTMLKTGKILVLIGFRAARRTAG